ncbi:hypothetical protein [Deinococcus aluminii]|uniref:Uncharacterized protein n=1 Tax=Deinococcus aluminii TaxID=1656885 RepID=A0ABP9XI58_9DEIO
MMGYPERIEAARADLAALEKDAQELQRLHAEKAAELEGLRASGSRDFARMAEIEGQRAALATMCADQEGEVGRARARLAALEVEAARDVRLNRIGEIASETAQIHADVWAGLDALTDVLRSELVRLFKLEGRWLSLHEAWMREAYELGQPVTKNSNPREADALYAELRARGVDVDALTAERFGAVPVHRNQGVTLISMKPDVDVTSPFADRVPGMVGALYVNAWNAWVEANTYALARKGVAHE